MNHPCPEYWAAAGANPGWGEKDWCWFFHQSLVRVLRKSGHYYEGVEVGFMSDCGAGCICRMRIGQKSG